MSLRRLQYNIFLVILGVFTGWWFFINFFDVDAIQEQWWSGMYGLVPGGVNDLIYFISYYLVAFSMIRFRTLVEDKQIVKWLDEVKPYFTWPVYGCFKSWRQFHPCVETNTGSQSPA